MSEAKTNDWTPFTHSPDDVRRARAIPETPQSRSPSYRLAFTDEEFLCRRELRPVRLQLELLKPEMELVERGIRSTVVLFGSARIPAPGHEAVKARTSVQAENLKASARYYGEARNFARLCSQYSAQSYHRDFVVVTGGGPGIMEAANRGARDTGARTVGFNITLPHEQFPNPYITPELAFRFHYFALRKLHFMKRARALVAFPGGYGTFDELFEALTLIQTRKIAPMPVILVGEDYWRRAVDIDFLVAEGTIDPEDRDLFWFAETAEEIWRDIHAWYEAAGRPFLP